MSKSPLQQIIPGDLNQQAIQNLNQNNPNLALNNTLPTNTNENSLATKVSALGPMNTRPLDPKGDNNTTGSFSNNIIDPNFATNIFPESSNVAANGMFGGNQIENSFSKPLPLSEQELNNDGTGMNSLYNNNKIA